ncbi:NUDIX hydrolase [Micromonospora sp. STR1s_5]|nr:NUDIX hydrolase [Micromonospora sp. STR1s_5]
MSSFTTIDGRHLRRKVRAIVLDPTFNILLIRPHGYAKDCWTLPGGGVEGGETPTQAAERELGEELGLRAADFLGLTSLNIFSEFIYGPEYKASRSLDHDGQLAEMFLCEVRGGAEIRRQVEEISDFRWFEPADASTAIRIPAQKSIFLRCLKGLESSCSCRSAAS